MNRDQDLKPQGGAQDWNSPPQADPEPPPEDQDPPIKHGYRVDMPPPSGEGEDPGSGSKA